MTDDARAGDAPSAEPAESPEDDDARRARLLAAWAGAGRCLSHHHASRTLAQQLAALPEAAAASGHDLGGWTDVYGDGVVAELERRTADLLGTEAAAFFPTGTMAQQVALRVWASRTGNPAVAVHPLAHPERWERDALSQLSGLRVVHPTAAPRLPSADEVRELDEPFGTLALELPLREAGFTLPSWDELTAVVEAARERDAVVHLDGARLWECTAHLGRGLPEIAGLADSVYVSFYKSLRGLSGAALAGPSGFVAEARAWRHRYGGNLFQQWPAALTALAGLERELPRLPEYVAHAAVVAEGLRKGFEAGGAPWFRVHPDVPHTHEFQVWLPGDSRLLTDVAARQAEETGTSLFRWWDDPGPAGPPGLACTEVSVTAPGLEWGADDVAEAARDFLTRVAAA